MPFTHTAYGLVILGSGSTASFQGGHAAGRNQRKNEGLFLVKDG
jgi:hypothetical protein